MLTSFSFILYCSSNESPMQMHKINREKVNQRLPLISTESYNHVWGLQALLIWQESSSLCFLPQNKRGWRRRIWQQKVAHFIPAVCGLDTQLEWTDLIFFFPSWAHLRNIFSNISTSSAQYEMHDALITWRGSGEVESLALVSELHSLSWKTQNLPR